MTTFTPDTDNEMFQLAIQLVNQSNRNIFLTGKAGTGKTTFLKYTRENCPKQMVIVAPTGVAAINAGGVTIHSFFQLPLAPFLPETKNTGFPSHNQEVSNKHSLLSHLRFNSEKKKLLRELELLVIDEISMVRCDTLDAIDTVLRHTRQRPLERFGGVQVLFIGDMLQLPPVKKEQEWNLLADYYNSEYFFDSQVLRDQPPVYIEFNKIYRQQDEKFIRLLNQVRNNELDDYGRSILESRFQPTFRRTRQDGYIILTTHNNKANEINAKELAGLESPLFSYQAEVHEEFSDRAYPADELLRLKVGSQVMFLRNDAADKGKRYYNGKIGVVTKLETDKIFVQCNDESQEIEVQKEKWENIRYTLNKTTRQLESDTLGSFTQYPLRLAWAITIHKSQGLTFEKAIIDAGEAFAPGQVYVALSRCTTLEGMVLQTRVQSARLFSDPKIITFSKNSASGGQLQQELAIAKQHYRQETLLATFDLGPATSSGKELFEYLMEHVSSFNPESFSWMEELLGKLTILQETAKKFQVQLQSLYKQQDSTEGSRVLQERIKIAAGYFARETGQLIQFIQQSPVITDSRLHAKEYNESIKEVFTQLAMKKFMFEGLGEGFDIEAFHRRKQKFMLPFLAVNAYAGASQKRTDSPHPALQQQLRKLRDTICSRKDLPIYLVAGSNTIDEMTRFLPQTLTELRKISGFGDARIRQYGQQFLDLILEYSGDNGLSSRIHEKLPKKERNELSPGKQPATGSSKKKGGSHAETLKRFKEGQSPQDIAKDRSLTIGTIETHLARFIASGEIKIDELLSREKRDLIEPLVKNYTEGSITSIKQQLGNDISFGEIRLVMAALGIGHEKITS
ncbi:MAG: helix-turn-helix domain-containing protein [Chitinophagaceae bacterium]